MNKEVKVLQVVGELGKGGDTSTLLTVIQGLKKRTPYIKFDFLTHKGCNLNLVDKLRKEGHKVFVLDGDVRKIGPIKYYSKMKDILKSNKYDIIHAHTSMQSGIILFTAKKCGITKRICHSHVTSVQRKANKLLKVVAIPIFRYLIKKYANIKVACGKDAGEFLFGKQKFTILYNGIDIDRFYFVDKQKVKRKKQELQIHDNTIIVGQIGSISTMKNQRFTLEIAKLVKLRGLNIQFLIIGDGEEFNLIKEQVERNELPIKLLGRQKEIELYMKLFDVLIMPSLMGEGLPMTLVEAQAAGCKCIKSNYITEEADMKLGLCSSIDVNTNFEEWLEKILLITKEEKVKVPIDNLKKSRFNKENSINDWKKIYE